MVLDRYLEIFSDVPGLCNMFEHEINVMPGFRPKQLKAYRISEKLKPEVVKTSC